MNRDRFIVRLLPVDGLYSNLEELQGLRSNVLDDLVYSVEVFNPPPSPQEVAEPSNITLIGMALLSLFGWGMMRRRADR